MRILLLTADASSNSLVRVYPLAKVLERRHEVHIAGFRSRQEVFPPYASELQCDTVQAEPMPAFIGQLRQLSRSVEADLVWAFKPLSTSLWAGLAVRRQLGIPLVLDIEDWELGWYLDRRRLDQAKHLAHVRSPNWAGWTAFNELLVRRADHVFVVSRFLQRRFGGTLLRHGPDTEYFDPARWPRERSLQRLGLPDASYVVFTGTPMPNKGLEEILCSLARLDRPDARLLVVGSFAHDPDYRELLLERWGAWLTLLEPRPHEDMPLFMSVATVVALPQRTTRETIAQVPGKVFEAMAMARPILATSVGDLPEILEGCGLMVDPENPGALEGSLTRLLDEPGLRQQLGEAARDRCVREFSWDTMEGVIEHALATVSR